jgi:RNA polymerase sigma factor (sigma-70 family)
MSMIHPLGHRVTFACAQAGCAECTDALVRQHQGLVQAVLRRQVWNGIPYEDLLQEGQIALWQAILHFDPQRGIAFSTYAWVAISRRLWQAIARTARPQGLLPPSEPPDPAELAAAAWLREQVQVALHHALACLPLRLRRVLVEHYGLLGQPPRSLAEIGRQWHLTRERVRQLRNEALALLRLPALSARLRLLCDQNTLAAYRQAEALHAAWLKSRRRR